MPTVCQLSAPYENFMLGPRRGQGVCDRCFNLTDGYDRCYACAHLPALLDAVAPISYSIAGEQLHHSLASYKRLSGEVARRLGLQLAALLWRYLLAHEACVARVAGAPGGRFDLVTAIPSGDRVRDECHPLRWIIGEVVGVTRGRYERLLRRSEVPVEHRAFDPAKFDALRSLNGQSVLLLDDTWTTGANAQCAAAALKSAGAGRVAVVVIGRHVNREWGENNRRLKLLPAPFDWSTCALCAPALTLRGDASLCDGIADAPAPRLTVTEEHDRGVDRLDRVE